MQVNNGARQSFNSGKHHRPEDLYHHKPFPVIWAVWVYGTLWINGQLSA